MVPRVGRRQDSAPCTRGSACISLSGASTATGPDSELGRAAPPAWVPPGASVARSFGIGCRPPGDVETGGQFAAVTLESGHCLPPREGRGIGRPGGPGCVSRDCRRARAGLGRPPALACQRGRRLRGRASAAAPFVRVCHTGTRAVAGEHSFCTFCTGTRRGLRQSTTTASCIGGFEGRVADD